MYKMFRHIKNVSLWKRFRGGVLLALMLTLYSCDNFLDITPTGKVIPNTLEEYRAMLTEKYRTFPTDRYRTTLRTDECTLDVAAVKKEHDYFLDLWLWKDEGYSATTLSFSSSPSSWKSYYHCIYIANYIIEHRAEITEGSSDDISQLLGEAYMMRAYNHFLLVNLYAQPYTHCTPASTRGIPVMLAADVNAMPRSSSVETVYQQVLSDLDEAAKYMKVEKWDKGYNYRFNVASVDALRARTYLYMGEWQKAYDAAKKVIDAYGDLQDISAKLPNDYESEENIVALEHYSAIDAPAVIYVNNDFLKLYRDGDLRYSKNNYQYFKMEQKGIYRVSKNTGYSSFRSAEAYLTAAEALAQLNRLPDAIAQLMPLLTKRLDSAALQNARDLMVGMSQAELLQEIYDERARELAFEGHRWFDLRRTTMPQLTRVYDGVTYTLTQEKYTFRFPTDAVEANPDIELWEE